MFGSGKTIDADKITAEIEAKTAVLVDVRGSGEWHGAHAKGAIHVPVDRIAGGYIPTDDTSRNIYLYCASGGRAGMAANILSAKGYTPENLGGLRDWVKGGGEIE